MVKAAGGKILCWAMWKLKMDDWSIQIVNPLSTNPTKWSNTQTMRRQFADELFECLTILWDWRLKG